MNSYSALSPAEALVLMEPNTAKPRDALKVSLMALLARRKLQILEDQRKGFFGGTTKIVQLTAPRAPGSEAPHEASLLGIVRSAQPVLMTDFITAAKRSYGGDQFRDFTGKLIAPALISRGLLKEVTEPFLLFFKRKRLALTPSGDVQRRRLEDLLDQARDIPRFLDSDPKKAAAMAVALGGLILLAPELQPHLAHIGDVMRHHGQSSDGGSSDSSSSSSSSDYSSSSATIDPAASEQLDMSGTFDLSSFDSAALDSMSASMETLDSSFDSASSDGGGDSGGDSGGGGDGGGGGGD